MCPTVGTEHNQNQTTGEMCCQPCMLDAWLYVAEVDGLLLEDAQDPAASGGGMGQTVVEMMACLPYMFHADIQHRFTYTVMISG